MPPLRRSLWLRRRCRPRHTSVCARRAAFARAPSSPLRLVRPLAPAGADGGAVGAQKAARPSRRVRCAPPVAACARARVRLRGKQRWGGACSPLWAAAPPPLLRPRPPLSVGGGGCGFHVSVAAGLRPLRRARKRTPLVGRSWRKHNIWCLPYLTAVFLLSHLVTQSAQEMSPVMFRQVRPMSNRRSTP